MHQWDVCVPGVESVHMCACNCVCADSDSRCDCVFVDILGVSVCVYLYIHACVHVQSECICRHVDVPMYVGVGRLYV